ncbi:MAG: hypothetical protein KAS66_01960 [Candidatus Omnitrophica bacterium]|nr:hypothetical protein [Candidatus Omnitrophota bacterium]
MSAGEILSPDDKECYNPLENVSIIYVPYNATSEPFNESHTLPAYVPTYFIPAEAPNQTYFLIMSCDTPVSKPYYVTKEPPIFEVGDWVKSNSEHSDLLTGSFQGQIVEINDIGNIIKVNDNEIRCVDSYWLDHWTCEMILHDPEIGYYCYTELFDNTYQFTDNTTLVSVIYADIPFGEFYE